METKYAYFVFVKGLDAIDELCGVFDSEEKVQAYLDRFKNRLSTLEVRKTVMNPSPKGDKSRNPYCISVLRNGSADIYPTSHPVDTDRAFDGEYETSDMDQPYANLDYHLLAESPEDAWSKGKAHIRSLDEKGIFKLDGVLRLDVISGEEINPPWE